MENFIGIKRVLISVFDKTGLDEFAKKILDREIEIFSTGGTFKALKDKGLPTTEVSEITNFPEILDGRVKTLHPKIHGGLLARRNDPKHVAAIKKFGIMPFDLLISNLYPFSETVEAGKSYLECIDKIDIGGPAMIRAAAKNCEFVTTIVDPFDYEILIEELQKFENQTRLLFRRTMAVKAFELTANYDSLVSRWMQEKSGSGFSKKFTQSGDLIKVLRYGENPHQTAAFYTDGSKSPSIASAFQHQGKELSFNNINDANAAFELVSEFASSEGAVCAIIKHTNPCGVARRQSTSEAYRAALACDPKSAFGGIVSFNKILDEETAKLLVKIFTEVVIAPNVTDEAKAIFAKNPKVRLLTTGGMMDPNHIEKRLMQITGGFLLQDKDAGKTELEDLKFVTKKRPNKSEIADLLFGYKIAKHAKSNAIVYVKNSATIGIGAGQTSRLDSVHIAADKALNVASELKFLDPLKIMKGSVLASEAFFPFPDGVLAAAKMGVKAIIQPGGSIRDEEIIAAANQNGVAMAFTEKRHFRH